LATNATLKNIVGRHYTSSFDRKCKFA